MTAPPPVSVRKAGGTTSDPARWAEAHDSAGQSITEFAETVFNAIEVGEIDRLIRSDKLREVGSLFVILGRGTFSAAMMFALDVEANTPVLFVVEPTGGRTAGFLMHRTGSR